MHNSFFNKAAGFRPATLLTKKLWYRYFPVNFAKVLRTLFLQNIFGGCFLIGSHLIKGKLKTRVFFSWDHFLVYFWYKTLTFLSLRDTYHNSTLGWILIHLPLSQNYFYCIKETCDVTALISTEISP